ncbi:radical SAM family heme chaperone HemW [Helicobacter sp.]|uniref:radical SAM family heme chaperone HemW n=1 Tax=Helicobacter sp. TaxID=218 RepID=UPI0025BEA3B6|nr:radical SAM family heme chaperone HemW [Helicobacter sp.]MBR2494677.1 radical SAM family heme chaperone HemW [Helicobacter sp.]
MILYIHIPFCASKCGYCAFSSYTGADSSVKQAYVQALLLDIASTLDGYYHGRLESSLLDSRGIEQKSSIQDSGVLESKSLRSSANFVQLDSIYIGGGTPSLLPSSAYALIFEQIARFCDMQSVQEITIEANPNSLQSQWCKDLASLGVTRISLGVQSFDKNKLAFLERDHSGQDIYQALEAAQVFPHRSIDMMYGTPFDDETTLYNDIQKACALAVDHLSAYSLMIEQGARFAYKYQSLATSTREQGDDLAMQAKLVRTITSECGFSQYEISNFARPYKCLHNRKYWAGEEYLGCGVGAVGRVGKVRYKGAKDLRAYIQNPLAKECENLSSGDLAFEAVFLGLRSDSGVLLPFIHPHINANRLAILLEEKICTVKDNYLLANDILLADEITLWLMRDI